jgi:hypothetical protein
MFRSIRVEAPDADSAGALERALRALGDARAEPLGGGAWDVRVLTGAASGRRVGEILSLVEDWLADTGVASTVVHIDGRAYTLLAPVAR